MNRKILVILSLIIVVVASGVIYAASTENTVEIDAFEFNIPDGYVEDVTAESMDEKTSSGGVDYTFCQKLFEKGNGDVISILVADYDGYEVTDEVVSVMGGEKTTINNVSGYLNEDNGIHIFSYPKDKKLVTITATDKDIFKDVVIEE